MEESTTASLWLLSCSASYSLVTFVFSILVGRCFITAASSKSNSFSSTSVSHSQQQQEQQEQQQSTSFHDEPSPSKEEILRLRQKHCSNALSVSYSNENPLLIVRASGCFLYDEQGCAYLDTRNNVAHCGHCHPAVVQAVQRQVQQLNTNTRYLHPHLTRLAQRLANLLPDPLEVVFFVNSGTEANDLALRLARAYTKSKNTIVVEGGYHGHSLATLEVSPYKYEKSLEYQPLTSLEPDPASYGYFEKSPTQYVWKVPCPNASYRGLYSHDDKDPGRKYASHVQKACDYFMHVRNENVSAFLVEGGMSVGGVILPPRDYLTHAVRAVRQVGGLYIADEVQTGFGRLGKCMWAFQYHEHDDTNRDHELEEEVVPDIVTVGKPFGNGMPLAAVVTTRAVATRFESMKVEYFNTFGGNPVSMAAGLAVLDVLEQEKLQEHALAVGSYLKERFVDLQETTAKKWIGDVRGCGLFLGVELVRDRTTKEPATAETSFLCSQLKAKYRVLTSIDGFHNNVLVVKPPMVFSRSNADQLIDSFEKCVTLDLEQAVARGQIQSLPLTPT